MIQESTAFREAALAGRLAFLDTGADPATLHVFGGERPASVNTSPATSPLCVITLTDPAGVVAGGALSLTQAEDGLITSSGEAAWCRVFNGAGQACFDMDAGVGGSGAEAIFNTGTLYAGGGLRLLSCTLG
jgi:hypothetical protein